MLVAAGPSHAQPTETVTARATDAPTESSAPAAEPRIDDLLVATGVRAIEKRRVEALLSAGTEATHAAALRATERHGSLGFELQGQWSSSDVATRRTGADARIEHASEHDRAALVAAYGRTHDAALRRSFASDVRTGAYGGEWIAWRPSGRYELGAYGLHEQLLDERQTGSLALDTSTYGARARMTSRRVQALDLDHEIGLGVGVTSASTIGEEQELDPEMSTHMQLLQRTRRGHHRFLSAYISDTIRVIESLDMHGGFVFEHWRWLSSAPPLYSSDEAQMDRDGRELVSFLLYGPRLGATYRVNRELTFAANGYRKLRAPTLHQLMRPVQNGEVLTQVGTLRPETVTGAEVGPAVTAGPLDARAVVYWNEVDVPIRTVTLSDTLRERQNLEHARETGVEAAASLRLAKPWSTSIEYTFASSRPDVPRHRATAAVTYDRPKLLTLTGGLRYVDRRVDDRALLAAPAYTVVDAMASRKLTRGLAGFVAVENLLDRRYVAHEAGIDTRGAPRMLHVGVRLDSARW